MNVAQQSYYVINFYIENAQENMESILESIKNIQTDNKNLHIQANVQNQDGRKHSAEVKGIPRRIQNENTTLLVHDLLRDMGIPIHISSISTAHRLPISDSKRLNGECEPILVKFNSRNVKNYLLSNRKRVAYIRNNSPFARYKKNIFISDNLNKYSYNLPKS